MYIRQKMKKIAIATGYHNNICRYIINFTEVSFLQQLIQMLNTQSHLFVSFMKNNDQEVLLWYYGAPGHSATCANLSLATGNGTVWQVLIFERNKSITNINKLINV